MIRIVLITLLLADTAVIVLLGVALVQEKPRTSEPVEPPIHDSHGGEAGLVQSSLSSTPPESPVTPTNEVTLETPKERADEKPLKPTLEKPLVTKVLKPASVKWHNIAFSFRNSRAKQVWLVGDFNKWKKGKDQFVRGKDKSTWTCIKRLKDGVYEYAYWVDGKMIVDPNNRRRQGSRSVLILPKPI